MKRQHRSRHPTQNILKEWLHYDSNSGVFHWKQECRPDSPLLGNEAGTINKKTNYIFIKIRGFNNRIAAHRLAWIYIYGDIPDQMEIDHIDGNPGNNAISNLRLATSRQQKMNKRVQSNNRARLKGAYYHAAHKGKKWRSQIKANGRYVFLGYYHTAWEAHLAYCEAAPKYFGKFARAA